MDKGAKHYDYQWGSKMKRLYQLFFVSTLLLGGLNVSDSPGASSKAGKTLQLATVNQETVPTIDFEKLRITLLKIIANTNTSISNLTLAIEHLGRPAEKSTFWTDICLNACYSVEHRRRCAFALLRRHALNSGSISELRQLLNASGWIQESDIDSVSSFTGLIPVNVTQGCTIFRIGIFSRRYSVYVSVIGENIARDDFIAVLLDRRSPVRRFQDFVIFELGVFDENTERKLMPRAPTR